MPPLENTFPSEAVLGLLARYLRFETSEEENGTVQAWLQEDERHPALLAHVAGLLSSANAADVKIDKEGAWQSVQARMDQSGAPVVSLSRFRKQAAWRAAAAVLILVIGSVILFKTFSSKKEETYFKGLASVTLKDGTQLRLEKDATVALADGFNNNNRSVTLTGDCFFQVAKDSTRPFIIRMANRSVTVLGTAFFIRQPTAGQGFDIRITEGVVKVADSLHRTEYKLIAGQELSLTDGRKEIKVNEPFQQLNFENVSLDRILSTLEKTYRIKLIPTASPPKGAYTIDLSSEPLEDGLATLSAVTGTHIQKQNDSVYTIK